MAALRLHYCLSFSLVAAVAVYGLLRVVASLAGEPRLSGTWLQWWRHMAHGWGSVALERRLSSLARGLSCSMAYGIFPARGWNSCLLHGQMDSLPLSHQGSLENHLKFLKLDKKLEKKKVQSNSNGLWENHVKARFRAMCYIPK